MSDEWLAAIDIISDITLDNPSLKEWIEQMVKPKQQKTQTQSQNSATIDTATISGPIESLISEVNAMQQWNPHHIEGIEAQLQEYQKMLTANQSSFEPNAYRGLMNDINTTLNKISRFYTMLNSEAMENIKLM